MSRSGSRYPSAYGHTPSYRSYVKGGLDSSPIGYSVGTSGLGSSSGLGSGLGSGSLGLSSSGLGSSSLGRSGLGASNSFDISLPSYGGGRDLGDFQGYSKGASTSKVSKSSYSSVSDSSRDHGRPIVEYSKDATLRSTTTGPSGIPHSSFAHSSSSYSSEDPYKNRVSNYSYNI